MDLASTVQRALRDVRARMHVDTVAVLLVDQSRQFLVAAYADGIEEEVREGARVPIGRGFAGRIAAERRPVILDRVGPDVVVNPLLVRRGIVSMLGVPLLTADRRQRDHVLGVLHVGSLVPRTFGDSDVEELLDAARGVSAAIVRHRQFVDRAAAAALQNSLAPKLPDVPGLQLAARYVPGSQYGVGGDWYDVFPLDSDRIGITIGDVMGHGLGAATVMGRVRSALRAYAIEHDDAGTVMTLLDRKMRHFEPGFMCTATYGVLDPATGAIDLCSAGHLPPMLVGPDGRADLLDIEVNPPIGVEAARPRRITHVQLDKGALLVLFTDGLVERRGTLMDDRLRVLRDVLSRVGLRSAEAVCAEVMTGMIHDRSPDDDISLLAIRRTAE